MFLLVGVHEARRSTRHSLCVYEALLSSLELVSYSRGENAEFLSESDDS